MSLHAGIQAYTFMSLAKHGDQNLDGGREEAAWCDDDEDDFVLSSCKRRGGRENGDRLL